MCPVATGWDPAKDRLLSGLTITPDGVKVGPCLVTGKIGQGGMGAVYRAWHTMLNLDVAVKILPFHLVDDNQAYVQRFQREAQAAAVVSHQNLVRVFEMGCEKEIYYLILEFVNGESAHGRLNRKQYLDEAEALRIIRDASYGLAAAHAKNIIHRDVKPDNILVGHDGAIKLADLGLAKIADADFAMTLSNVAMGTPQFMPPEQIKNSKAVTFASDIWAMGISLYYMLTGKYPFNAENLIGLLNIINDQTPDIATVRKGVSPATKAVIDRCLQKAPEARYKTASDLIAAIDEALRELPTHIDLTVPEESCLASKLAPYTPGLAGGEANLSAPGAPGSDAPTLVGQGATSSRGSRGPTPSEGSTNSTLRLPPRGAATPPNAAGQTGAVGVAGPGPFSTSAPTGLAEPATGTVITSAGTVYAPGGQWRILPLVIGLLIVLPLTGLGLYWAFKIKPYDDAVATAKAFEAKEDFANAAAAWKSARDLSPTGEATEHFTENDKLAGLLSQIQQAQAKQDWQTVAERCAAFLQSRPASDWAKKLQATAAQEQRQATLTKDLLDELPKIVKTDRFNFYSVAGEYKKRLDAALTELPESLPLRQAYVELVLAYPSSSLEYLDQALKYLDACLKIATLDAVKKTELLDLQKHATERRAYAYRYKMVDDPLSDAYDAAKKRLEEMVANLEDPQAGYAAALALITKIEPGLPADAEGRDDVIAKKHEEFEKEYIRQVQELSQAAQRKGNYTLALAALEPVVPRIDEFYRAMSVHAVAMLKRMKRIQELKATPPGAIKTFANDGSGKTIAAQNLPTPDLRQIRLLRVIDADNVVALIDGRFYLTTLEFKTWSKVTSHAFTQDAVVLSPDLARMTDLGQFVPQQGETAPKDTRRLYLFENAGDSRAFCHAALCTTDPQFQFSPDGGTVLFLGHPVNSETQTLYAFEIGTRTQVWEPYGTGFKVLKTATNETLYAPQFLADGERMVYSAIKGTVFSVNLLQVNTGKITALLSKDGGAGAADGAAVESARVAPRMLAPDPAGKYVAVFVAGTQTLEVLRLDDGKTIQSIAAKDVDPARTGPDLQWSTDGKWLVYKALDGESPVFKVVGVVRE